MDPPMEREAISRVSLKKVKTNLKNKGMIKSERVRQEQDDGCDDSSD